MRVNQVVTLAFTLVLVTMLGGCSSLDGPTGPFPGGRLRTGTLVSEPAVDWQTDPDFSTEEVEAVLIELQLVEPLGSRTVGSILHEGQLYVACDLGFLWRRIPAYHPAHWMLHTINVFKHWHEDALLDGRVVLRIAGKRYERQAVRVTDPELLATLRLQLEEMAEQWVSPEPLGEAPTEGPRDIWFFRVDPRPTA